MARLGWTVIAIVLGLFGLAVMLGGCAGVVMAASDNRFGFSATLTLLFGIALLAGARLIWSKGR